MFILGTMEPPRARYWLLAVALVLAGLAGYAGYVVYPRFALPAGVGAGLLVLAAAAGTAAFFSPCSFPLLVTLLTREAAGKRGAPATAALRFAVPTAAGAAAFLLLTGTLIALGGRELVSSVTFTSVAGRTLRISIGALLIFLGLIQASLLRISFHGFGERIGRPLGVASAGLRRRRPVAGLALYGFGYVLAGFG